MVATDTLEAANRLLATLGAARGALLGIAAERLPFDRLVAVHVAAGAETDLLDAVHTLIDRRVAVMRARIYSGVVAEGPPAAASSPAEAPAPTAERTDDEPTPRSAAAAVPEAPLIPPRGRAPARIARAMERAGSARATEPPPPPPAAAIEAPEPPPMAVEAPGQPEGEPATAIPETIVDVAAPVVEAPPPVAEAAPPVAEAAEPEPATQHEAEPAAAHDDATPIDADLPASIGEEDLAEDARDVPSEPQAGPARIAIPQPGPASVDLRAAKAVTPTVRLPDEETSDAPSGSEPLEEAEESLDDADEAGTGSAVGGGLRVGGRQPRTTTPSLAPRLTDDDDEDNTRPTQMRPEVPSIAPAGEDARVIEMAEEARGFAERGELQKAIAGFTDVIELRHDRMEAYIGRGRCHLELGDYSSAMSDFQRAEDLQPDRPDSHVAMGDLYFARKEYRRAIEFYDQAVELDGSHAMARCRRGISHYYRKNYRQAFQDLQRAYSLDPEIPNIRKYVQMAVKKMERGD